jgi:hypothetical protein
MALSVAMAQGADAASTKKKAEPEDLNANSKKLLVDGLPLVMPSAVMYYMLYQKQVDAEKAKTASAKPKRKHSQ